MALPSSGVLSISMINVELGRASNAPNSSLQGLANLAKTGSTPYINRANPRMSHWYGYEHVTVVSYIYFGDMTGYSTRALACQNSTNHSLYYSASSFVQSGMILYHDSNLTIPFVGNGQYYSIYPNTASPTVYSGTINSSGSFSNIEDCVAAPTYTQVYDKFYDPCGSQVTNLYEDSLGRLYLLVSGNYGLYNGYLYQYIGPLPSNQHQWVEERYVNGELADNVGVVSTCAPY